MLPAGASRRGTSLAKSGTAVTLPGVKTSARNQLRGRVAHRGTRLAALLGLLALAFGAAAGAADLHVAVAANFSAPLQRLAVRYGQSTGNHLIISAGSSGQLYTQIKQGAPFDVFLSADTAKPEQLERDGLALAGTRCIYAVGTLVLWSPQPGRVDGAGAVLGTRRYRLLGIANPDTAPYGSAARQVLSHLGLWDRLNQEHRIVTGENITQTWQFASTGNAEMAFVALSQVIGADGRIQGSSWLPPQSLYDPIEQGAVALAGTPEPAAASAFLTWLRTDAGALDLIHAAGYHTAR